MNAVATRPSSRTISKAASRIIERSKPFDMNVGCRGALPNVSRPPGLEAARPSRVPTTFRHRRHASRRPGPCGVRALRVSVSACYRKGNFFLTRTCSRMTSAIGIPRGVQCTATSPPEPARPSPRPPADHPRETRAFPSPAFPPPASRPREAHKESRRHRCRRRDARARLDELRCGIHRILQPKELAIELVVRHWLSPRRRDRHR